MMETTPPPDPTSSGSSPPPLPPNSPRAFLRRAAQALEQSPLKDVQRNVRALAHSAAGRLDLVTREEFDALQAMLNASAQRVAQLEAQVAALESHLAAAAREQAPSGSTGSTGAAGASGASGPVGSGPSTAPPHPGA